MNVKSKVLSVSVPKIYHFICTTRVDADFLLEEGIKILQRSRTRPACVMRVHGFVLVYHHTFLHQ